MLSAVGFVGPRSYAFKLFALLTNLIVPAERAGLGTVQLEPVAGRLGPVPNASLDLVPF